MEKEILIIIDVQPAFESALPIVNNVRNEIKRAHKKNIPIVNVKYGRHWASHVQPKKNTTNITKWGDNGSEEINAKIKCPKIARIIGVNLDACVYETVLGLIDYWPETEFHIVHKAVNSWQSNGKLSKARVQHFVNKYYAHPRVKVI